MWIQRYGFSQDVIYFFFFIVVLSLPSSSSFFFFFYNTLSLKINQLILFYTITPQQYSHDRDLMELKFRVAHFKGTQASITKKVIEKIKGIYIQRERDERKYHHLEYYSYVQQIQCLPTIYTSHILTNYLNFQLN